MEQTSRRVVEHEEWEYKDDRERRKHSKEMLAAGWSIACWYRYSQYVQYERMVNHAAPYYKGELPTDVE
jgi:hypothetical protein